MNYLRWPKAVAILASRSAAVVQVTLVPALFTRGSAAHIVPPAQGVATNAPPTHCAKEPEERQASVPVVHEDLVGTLATLVSYVLCMAWLMGRS